MLKGLILFVLGWALILGGGFLAKSVQTSGGIQVTDVRFPGADGRGMSALLYAPAGATARNPAPGILAVHGYINSRETQDGFAIEFARRGYVVLALDQSGHGYSDPPAFSGGFGGPAGLAYLRSLPMVDKANIGLEGHSMGGWTILAAARAMPDDYRAMVLEGSSTGSGFAAEGDPRWPRNLAVVYSQYDEFSKLMWGVDHAKDVVKSPKLGKVFGAALPIVPGQLYGDPAAGTARALYTPATTHPGDHFSNEAIGDAADWFARTLKGGTPRPASDQVWIWKEVGTLIGFAGFLALLLGTFDLALRLPVFADLPAAPAPVRTRRDGRWWLALSLSAAIPVLSFYPFMGVGAVAAPPSFPFRQSITSQIMVWALLNALIIWVLGAFLRSPKAPANTRWTSGVLIALITVGVGYFSLWVADALFKVDFRFWVVALKLMSAGQVKAFAFYVIPFSLFFVVALSALHRNLAVAGEGAGARYGTAITALAAGFLVFLAAEYIPLFAGDQLLTPSQPLNTVVAIQFLPLMAVVGVISAFTWKRTNSALPGALICGLFVTWYMVAGTATHWAPGMPNWPA
ncbi:MAG TPA: alpha/beta fold hydrolase [Caulobacteraceae bacterium]